MQLRPSQRMPTTPIADERAGDTMLYSSGTTTRVLSARLPAIM